VIVQGRFLIDHERIDNGKGHVHERKRNWSKTVTATYIKRTMLNCNFIFSKDECVADCVLSQAIS
jgi:hypothetical protein